MTSKSSCNSLIPRAKWADIWFENLESVVHSKINQNRKDKRVRIAILDTGVDSTHPDIQVAISRKQICRFFPETSDAESPLDPRHDENGHGTHGTSVLIRVAPNATIYVARVADAKQSLYYDHIVEVYLYSLIS